MHRREERKRDPGRPPGARACGRRGACLALGLLLPATLAGAATGSPSTPPTAPPPDLPRAEIHRPTGIAPELTRGHPNDRVRIAILLNRQPVLRKTTTPRFEAALTGYTRGDLQASARRSPTEISDEEVAAGSAMERRRSALARRLLDEFDVLADAQAPVERAIERSDGRTLSRDPAASGPLALVVAKLPRREISRLHESNEVQAVLAAPRRAPELDTSTTTIAASSVFAEHSGGGDDGYGGASDVASDLDVGMAGDPPNPDHPAFAGIEVDNGTTSPGSHGTSTTGVIASRDSSYRGVAPGIASVIGGVADNWGAVDVDARNESFGNLPADDRNADVADLAADAFMVPWAASAGNRNDDPEFTPGDPTVGGNSIGRNIVSVGAIADGATLSETDDGVAAFTSWGPTPGGRKKPDLVAPGVAITGPALGGGFSTETGTSVAAPHAAGALAILVGAGMTDPRAMRAVLVNSAEPWCHGHYPGHDPPQGPLLVDDPNPVGEPSAGACQSGWEPDVGWGELDIEDALAQRGNAAIGEVEPGKARFYRADVGAGDRSTLAWNMRGILGPDVTQHVYYTVTNLNLRQYLPDGTSLASPGDPGWGAGPDAVDPNDTVEQVRAESAGEVVYKVSADSTVEGQAFERFAIASANALEPLESPDVAPVDLAQSGSGPVNCGETVTVTARLENPSSDLEAASPSLTLELPAGLELVAGAATQQLGGGSLAVDATSEQAAWTVRPRSTGSHSLSVRGDGTAYETVFSNRAPLEAIAADCSPPRVEPTGLTLSPSNPVACGQPQTISTSFRNPTITDATAASADLASGGAELVSGSSTQAVAGGTLTRGATSGVHSWTLRLPTPGPGATATATVTVTGRTELNSGSFPASTTLRCTRATEPPQQGDGNVRLAAGSLRSKRDGRRLVAKGRLDGSGPEPVTGKVEVEFKRLDARNGNGRRTERAEIGSGGRFKAVLETCRRGEYKAFAEYDGSDDHESMRRTRLGSKEKHRGC